MTETPDTTPATALKPTRCEMFWQIPDGHTASVSMVREYEVELTYPDGGRAYRSVGPDAGLAAALAASSARWDPPGPPGVIRYRDVVTVTGAWTLPGVAAEVSRTLTPRTETVR